MSSITNVSITAMHVGKTISFECADLKISQEFKPNWSTENAYGKMDPIANFTNTDRTAKFSMILLANQLSVAKQMQAKIGKFIQFNYPKYSSKGGAAYLSSPPYFKINCLQNKLYTKLQGFITNVSITPGSDQKVVPLTDNNGRFFERRYDVEFGLTVMHSHIVGYIGNTFSGGPNGGFVFYGDSSDSPDLNKSQAAKKSESQPTHKDATAMYEFAMNKKTPATMAEVAIACGATGEDTLDSVKNFTAPPIGQSLVTDKTDTTGFSEEEVLAWKEFFTE